jgi:hypothetical protein
MPPETPTSAPIPEPPWAREQLLDSYERMMRPDAGGVRAMAILGRSDSEMDAVLYGKLVAEDRAFWDGRRPQDAVEALEAVGLVAFKRGCRFSLQPLGKAILRWQLQPGDAAARDEAVDAWCRFEGRPPGIGDALQHLRANGHCPLRRMAEMVADACKTRVRSPLPAGFGEDFLGRMLAEGWVRPVDEECILTPMGHGVCRDLGLWGRRWASEIGVAVGGGAG